MTFMIQKSTALSSLGSQLSIQLAMDADVNEFTRLSLCHLFLFYSFLFFLFPTILQLFKCLFLVCNLFKIFLSIAVFTSIQNTSKNSRTSSAPRININGISMWKWAELAPSSIGLSYS